MSFDGHRRPLFANVVGGLTDMAKPVPRLSAEEIQRAVAVAWDDRPPFNAVLLRCGLSHGQTVQLMKRELSPNAYKVWTARTREASR